MRNTVGYVTAAARFKYQGHEIRLTITDDGEDAFVYSGPGGTYEVQSVWSYDGFDYELWRKNEDGTYEFVNSHNYAATWDGLRLAAIELAAGVREWER